jgi:hypothetical protein
MVSIVLLTLGRRRLSLIASRRQLAEMPLFDFLLICIR